MILVWTANILTILLLVGTLIGLFVLIARRRRMSGATPQIKRYISYPELLREGFLVIRQCPWVLIIPLAASIVGFIASIPSTRALMRNRADAHHAPMFLVPGHSWFSELDLRAVITYFLDSAALINRAMLSGFHSYIMAAVCMFAFMFVLLRRGSPAGIHSDFSHKAKMRNVFGVAAGVAGLVPLIVLGIDAWRRWQTTSWQITPYYVLLRNFLLLPIWCAAGIFASATLLSAMNAAADKKRLSIMEAMSEVERYFLPLLCFALIETGVSLVAAIPLLVPTEHLSAGASFLNILLLLRAMQDTLLVMICFVPAIIVVRRTSILPAFKHCIEIWARYPLSATSFVVLSAALLLPSPILLHHELYQLFWNRQWTIYIISLPVSLLRISVGVLVICSMVVFYKKVRQSLEEVP